MKKKNQTRNAVNNYGNYNVLGVHVGLDSKHFAQNKSGVGGRG